MTKVIFFFLQKKVIFVFLKRTKTKGIFSQIKSQRKDKNKIHGNLVI